MIEAVGTTRQLSEALSFEEKRPLVHRAELGCKRVRPLWRLPGNKREHAGSVRSQELRPLRRLPGNKSTLEACGPRNYDRSGYGPGPLDRSQRTWLLRKQQLGRRQRRNT